MELSARDRILGTAHDLFYRDGVRATGVDRVIAEAGVTKVTFYRHFPSKNDLVLAFLAHRHERWMAWFIDALARNRPRVGPATLALVPALREWFADSNFRGCAFINTAVELGGVVPGAAEAVRAHKADLTEALAALLPSGRGRAANAAALALLVDGAIVSAQIAGEPDLALKALSRALRPWGGPGQPAP